MSGLSSRRRRKNAVDMHNGDEMQTLSKVDIYRLKPFNRPAESTYLAGTAGRLVIKKLFIVHAAVHTHLLFCKKLLASFRKHFNLLIKGSVQRKLRWVKNSTNGWVLAWCGGAGHYFSVLFYLHLGFAIFPWCCVAPHRQSAARSPRGANL